MRSMITLPMFLAISAAFAHADAISYTFTGADGVTGTDWTLVDPNGYIPDDTNVVNLLTSSTDFISMGVNYGPLIGIGDVGEQSANSHCIDAGTPCFGINMAITYDGTSPYVIPFFFAGNDGTSGTFTELQTGSTLAITAVPEPGFAALMLLAAGLFGLLLAMRKRNTEGLL
jgi:hypothetical protein